MVRAYMAAAKPEPADQARLADCLRTRAAMELAGLTWRGLAKRAKPAITPDSVRRLISKTKPRGFVNDEERQAVARACNVPMWFLEEGLPAPAGTTVEERLAVIERRLGIRPVAPAAVAVPEVPDELADTLRRKPEGPGQASDNQG